MTEDPQFRAVIFIPHRREQDRWQRVCHEAIERNGDLLAGIVVAGQANKSWADAQAMVDGGEADIIVVARWDHVPAAALNHVRVVAEEHRGRNWRQRRPRVIE